MTSFTPAPPRGMRIVKDREGEFLLPIGQRDKVVSHRNGFFAVEQPQELHFFELLAVEANLPFWVDGEFVGPYVVEGRARCLDELAQRRALLDAEKAILAKLGIKSTAYTLHTYGEWYGHLKGGWVQAPTLPGCPRGALLRVGPEDYRILYRAEWERAHNLLPR